VIDDPILAVSAESLLAMMAEEILSSLRRSLSDMIEAHQEGIRILHPVVTQQTQDAGRQQMTVPKFLRLQAKSAEIDWSRH
jgi:hypothetical protein